MKFIGSLSQLKSRFSDLGVTGAWWCGQGYHELRTDDGVVVHWWPSIALPYQGIINQAVGRNSGFRKKGNTKTVVITSDAPHNVITRPVRGFEMSLVRDERRQG